MSQRLFAILFWLVLPGCVIVETGVTNPVPGLSRVAVVPFRNLSSEPDQVVDGRRIAMAYFSELQKVPGFEVVPVGVAEVEMLNQGLDITGPEDALKLARLLEVDAIVVGAVTEFDPYYPPRLGLHVEWLSPHPWAFFPGVQIDPTARERLLDAYDDDQREKRRKHRPRPQRNLEYLRRRFGQSQTVRGQSADGPKVTANVETELTTFGAWLPPDGSSNASSETLSAPRPRADNGAAAGVSVSGTSAAESPAFGQTPPPTGDAPSTSKGKRTVSVSQSENDGLALPTIELNPAASVTMPTNAWQGWLSTDPAAEPLMSYSRIFDGADADLVAELRDYVELSGDLRSGGWEAYLQRSEDFIRFACRRMIVEMLTLHGGEGRRRVVLKLRKYK